MPASKSRERLRVSHEIHESVPRRARGRVKEGERGRVRVEERESPVHDEEADGDLLEDGAREEARLLAALALRRDETGEAGERLENLLRSPPTNREAVRAGGPSAASATPARTRARSFA